MTRRLSILVAAAVAVSLMVASPDEGVAAGEVCEDLPGASLVQGELGGSTPVVLVHGFMGSSVTWFAPIDQAIDDDVEVHNRSFVEQLMRIDGVSIWLFDYADTSARWVTDPSIGPALADLLQCLADNGGQPAVLVVHSMGGLAARQAMTGLEDTSIVSGLVTFGTPHLGSDMAAYFWRLLQDHSSSGGFLGPIQAAVRYSIQLCGETKTQNTDYDCGWLDALPPIDSEAGRALIAGSKQLDALPPMPDHVQVVGLAGEIEIVVQDSKWGFFYESREPWPIGDMSVSIASAITMSDESRAWTCQLNFKKGYAISDDARQLFQLNYDDGKERGISELTSNPCQHSNLIHTVEITNEALYHINAIAEQQRPACVAGGNLTCVNGFEFGIDYMPDMGQTLAYSIVRYDAGEWHTVGESLYDIEDDVPITVLRSLGADPIRSRELCTLFASAHGLNAVSVCHLVDPEPVGYSTPLTLDGLGPITPGMSLNELNAATGQFFEFDIDEYWFNGGACFFAWTRELDGLGLAMGNERTFSGSLESTVGAIWVWDGFVTDTGIGVGASEAMLIDHLGSELTVQPHEYVQDGAYYDLTVPGSSPEPLTMRFTVESGVISAISFGYHSWATLTEACS